MLRLMTLAWQRGWCLRLSHSRAMHCTRSWHDHRPLAAAHAPAAAQASVCMHAAQLPNPHPPPRPLTKQDHAHLHAPASCKDTCLPSALHSRPATWAAPRFSPHLTAQTVCIITAALAPTSVRGRWTSARPARMPARSVLVPSLPACLPARACSLRRVRGSASSRCRTCRSTRWSRQSSATSRRRAGRARRRCPCCTRRRAR